MLNTDKMSNLQAKADAVASSLNRAWMHFNLIAGIREAASKDPEGPLVHPLAFAAINRAAFDALYVAIGQVTDTRSDTESLHTLANMARRYSVDPAVIKHVESVLASTKLRDGSPLHRLRRWRHEHTAHRTLEASTPEFYAENKLDLGEIEQSIAALDSALSEITMAVIGVKYDTRYKTDQIADSCAALLSRYAS